VSRRHVTPVFVLAAALFACGEEAPSRAQTEYGPTTQPLRDVPRGYSFTGTPVILLEKSNPGSNNYTFGIIARLDRALPRTRRGIRAAFVIDGQSGYQLPEEVDRANHCYIQLLGNGDEGPPRGSLRHPRSGQRVNLTLELLRGSRQVASRRVTLRSVAVLENDTYRAPLARLGCSQADLNEQ